MLPQKPLHWHPKFRPYWVNSSYLLLVSERLPLCLPRQHYPWAWLINGEGLLSELLESSQIPLVAKQEAMGQVFSFLQQGVLATDPPDYVTGRKPEGQWLNEQVYSLSAAPEVYQQEWLDLVRSAGQAGHYVLVDDPLDHRLQALASTWAATATPWRLLKITGEQLAAGPWSTPRHPLAVPALQQRLLQNQPVLRLVKELFPEQDHFLPFAPVSTLPLLVKQQLGPILQEPANSTPPLWTLLEAGKVSCHPLALAANAEEAFVQQVKNPVVLQPCASPFAGDGGARSVPPMETVARLKPFISPVTGVITHLEEHRASAKQPVKIFTTAFWKTPARHELAQLGQDVFVQPCLGKGVAPAQSMASALCEAVERYAALYQGYEPCLKSLPQALPARHYEYNHFAPFSELQYQRFAEPGHPDAARPQAVKPYTGTAIGWCPTWSLNQQGQVYVPYSLCFRHCPLPDTRFGRWQSNGCAAGNTVEEAVLQGLLELLERDAVALWWYNRVARPGLSLSILPQANAEALDATLGPTHDYWLLNLTTNIGVPVVAAIGQNKQTGGFSFGFGCHLSQPLAAQRALTELCQLIPIRNQPNAPFDFNAIVDAPYLHASQHMAPVNGLITPCPDLKEAIEEAVGLLGRLSLEVLVLNYTRQPLPVHTVKVLVPGLCHIWPQLGNPRLYHAPVSMGWQAAPLAEEDLNPQPLYI